MNKLQTTPLRAAFVQMEWNYLTKILGYVLKNVVSVMYTLNRYNWSEFIHFMDNKTVVVFPNRMSWSWGHSSWGEQSLQIWTRITFIRQFIYNCDLLFQFNEKFEYKCQDCICSELTKTVICKPKTCPAPPIANCTGPGFVVVNQTNPKDPCCFAFVCRKRHIIFFFFTFINYCLLWKLKNMLMSSECEINTCSVNNMNCPVGYKPVVSVPEGKCCPEHICGELYPCLNLNWTKPKKDIFYAIYPIFAYVLHFSRT